MTNRIHLLQAYRKSSCSYQAKRARAPLHEARLTFRAAYRFFRIPSLPTCKMRI